MTAGLARRIADATPGGRDRTVDLLRAVAILGVVVGHWLVSAVVSDPVRPDRLLGASPLTHLSALAPTTWLLETVGPFFFAGGCAAARSARGRAPLGWLVRRARRLVVPPLVLLVVWAPAMLLLTVARVPAGTRDLVVSLVTHPLWFLLVYLVLTAATPWLRLVIARHGPGVVVLPLAVVAATDLSRSVGPPEWLRLVDVLAGWLVPYLLGVALAEGRLPRRRSGWTLLAVGVLAGAALIGVAGYPVSAVGVPGAGHWSNLDPPSLFALALTAVQVGVFLLARPRLAAWLRRPGGWAPVAGLNLVAMTMFCWHQSAMLLVSFGGLVAGRLPGLHDAPVSAHWVAHRLAWLPAFALVLVVLTALFHWVERRSAGTGRPGGAGGPPIPPPGADGSPDEKGYGLRRRERGRSGSLSTQG